MSASSGWQSSEASLPADGALRFEFKARPTAEDLDGLVAVGAQDIDDFTKAAITVRFAEDGFVDARDGGIYDSDVTYPYDPGVWYSVSVSADIQSETYDVEIGPCGEPQQKLIENASFRDEANVSGQLSAWAVWSSQSAALEVSTPAWIASSGGCAPSTCETLGHVCGQPSDGCGGVLSCGACGTGEMCSSGICVDASVPPPPCQPATCQTLSAECGLQSNGCGGTLSCGTCSGGEACAAGTCIDISPPPGGGGVPGGLADDCPMGSPLGSACVCGGSVYSTGFCCEEGYSFSECSGQARYVRPGGGGRQDGSDWGNAFDGLPSVLERGTTYWLGSGSYGSYTFDDGASGQRGVTLRKATTQEHGTNVGWSAAYGNGQAIFGPLDFSASRYTIDGGEPNGIRTVGQMGTGATVDAAGGYLVLRHVEIDGGLQKSNGTQTAGGCNGSNVRSDYVVFDRCEIHNIADDGLEIHSADHVKVLYSKIHNLHACGTDAPCSGPCYNGHSDGLELSNISDIELIGNMVYDVRSTAAIFMDNWSGSKVYDFVVYNNVFYTPDSSFAVYLNALQGAKFHNNVIWGRTQGSRYGGLAMGRSVTDLEMHNNIILNINYSHMGASHDPTHHNLDHNLFGMIDSGEYQTNTNDLVADPRFAGVPMSGNEADHKGSALTIEDFVPAANEAIDTGTASGSVPAYDIMGAERPQGGAHDRGVFEVIR